MVSPCKKKRFDKKGKVSGSCQNTVSSSVRKKTKPLTDKKFYLDIRNHATLKKIEEKLIALGGVIEVFLVRDVDYVVTDRRGSQSSPASAPSPATESPSDVAQKANRTRSRGEAMLEKVKQQTLRTTCDILDKATSWKIPVYSLQKFLQWLDKTTKKVERVVSGSRSGLRELRGNFVKLETGLRPDFKLLGSEWPRLNLTQGGPAFQAAPASGHVSNTNNNRMTRKSGSKLLVGGGGKNGSSIAGSAGYCEVCRVNYGWLEEHISSVGHIKAVTDPSQYQELDTLIGNHSLSGLRKSLRIAKSPPPVVSSSPQRTVSPPPPTLLQCNGHQTPPRNSTQVLTNGTDSKKPKTSEEKKSHKLRSRLASPPSVARGKVSRKRLSAEEKLIEDNKAYYKVEVLNSKLRSTGCLQKQQEIKEEVEEDMGGVVGSLVNGQAEQHPVEEPVVVRFKKVRKSQLAVLSDEAENFMFGNIEKKEDESQSNDTSCEESNKRKRRTHAEVFINDNTDYYKFEMAGSRLRYQGTTLAHVPSKEEPEESDAVEEKEDEKDDGQDFEFKLSDVTFSFEMKNMEGIISKVQRRQESCKEEWLPMYYRYPTYLLPCELPYQERLKMLVRRRRRMSKCLDDKPRKSPRCHASTLAIMSTLMPRTRLAEPPPSCDEDTTASSITIESSSNSDSNSQDPRTIYSRLAQYMLSFVDVPQEKTHEITRPEAPRHREKSHRKSDPAQILVDQIVNPDLKVNTDKQPLIPLLDSDIDLLSVLKESKDCLTLEQCLQEAIPPRAFDSAFFDNSCNSSDCSEVFGFSEDGRSVFGRRRKRKKRNMTGWPQEKPKKKVINPYLKKYRSGIKSEPIDSLINGIEDAQSEAPSTSETFKEELMMGLVSSFQAEQTVSPVKRRPGRPRIYPPGLSPHLKKKFCELRGLPVYRSPARSYHSPKPATRPSTSHSYLDPLRQ